MSTRHASDAVAESARTLWVLTLAPLIWAAHLLLSYVTVAIWCEKIARPGGSLGSARAALVIYTVIALAAVALLGWRGLRWHRHATETSTHDLDTPEDRHRFLGFSTLLLAGLSALAILYAMFAMAFFEGCG